MQFPAPSSSKSASSDPLKDKLSSYALPNYTQSTPPPYKLTPLGQSEKYHGH